MRHRTGVSGEPLARLVVTVAVLWAGAAGAAPPAVDPTTLEKECNNGSITVKGTVTDADADATTVRVYLLRAYGRCYTSTNIACVTSSDCPAIPSNPKLREQCVGCRWDIIVDKTVGARAMIEFEATAQAVKTVPFRVQIHAIDAAGERSTTDPDGACCGTEPVCTTCAFEPPIELALTHHFQCYELRPPAAFERSGISLDDRFGTRVVGLRKAYGLCAPADENDEDPVAPSEPTHLTSYGVRSPGSFAAVRNQEVVNQFGTQRVDLVKPARLLVPTAKSTSGPTSSPAGAFLDHFQCYKVTRSRGAAAFTKIGGVTVETQFETAVLDVLRPLRLCVPVDKNGEAPGAEGHLAHLMCYRARGGGRFPGLRVFLNNQLGQQTYDLSQRRELCVPSVLRTGSTTTTTVTTTTSTTIYASPVAAFLAPVEGLVP